MANPSTAALRLVSSWTAPLTLALLSVAVFGSCNADAQERSATSRNVKGVVELFTSQGCMDCTPANALLGAYAKRPDLIALAYHVDYWDYIGWQDPLGSRKNAERQKAYAKRLRLGTLTTPQMIVNGDRAVSGGNEAAVLSAVADAPLAGSQGVPEVRLETRDETLHIFADMPARSPDARKDAGASVLMLVTYVDEVQTKVARGENEGRSLVDSHAVRDWRVVGTVSDEPMRIEMPIALLADPDGQRTGCVALLQTVGTDDKPGRILAAASLEF